MGGNKEQNAELASLFSEQLITVTEYKAELEKIAGGIEGTWAREHFDPAHPLEHTDVKWAMGHAFGSNAPDQKSMSLLIGVSHDTLKSWLKPKGTKGHRRIKTEQFARIVSAGADYRWGDWGSLPFVQQNRREKLAREMIGAHSLESRRIERHRCKVQALALRAAAMDEETLELLSGVAKRLFLTSKANGVFDDWENDQTDYLLSEHLHGPEEGDERGRWITREQYFPLVDSAETQGNAALMQELWDAQPYESPLIPEL